MCKDVFAIISFVRDGMTTEFLYTSKTFSELIQGGFRVISAHSYTVDFELFGESNVISGFYNFNNRAYMMVYVINENGKILWNFQPMGDYVNFYSIEGISFADLDGDGLKDVTILAKYVKVGEDGTADIISDYNVYCQRAGFFEENKVIKNIYEYAEQDTLDDIVLAARGLLRYEVKSGSG